MTSSVVRHRSPAVKNPPVFKARLCDLKAARNRRFKGEMAMEVIIYLPGIAAPFTTKPRLFSYCDDRGKEIMIMFQGAQIALNDKRLHQLCKRLAAARRSLVGYVRRLATAS